jgi:transcriptional regulator with XRE-family HTH domain
VTAAPAAADPFAAAIARLRAERALSYAEFADQCGISKSLAVMLETGARRPSRATIDLIADALGLHIAQRVNLLYWAGYSAPAPVWGYLMRAVDGRLPPDLSAR